ncbi:hypothetical protein SAMN05216244_1995 [Sediminibacillus halophilus]|uniref:Uncharacterized protein n=1 Tax=Sediminibacillus halophilus TaxID=482461 RepID=A0A1G9RHG4_9BACI|nr:hypothetical protein SAMN05216244_1995 [Sediminibacillus halophilus]
MPHFLNILPPLYMVFFAIASGKDKKAYQNPVHNRVEPDYYSFFTGLTVRTDAMKKAAILTEQQPVKLYLQPMIVHQFLIPIKALFFCTLERAVIHMDETEAFAIAFCPFKIVEKRPGNISF